MTGLLLCFEGCTYPELKFGAVSDADNEAGVDVDVEATGDAAADARADPDDRNEADEVDPSPASLCKGSGLLACEGFEGPAVGAGWNIYTANGTTARDTTRLYRGLGSVDLRRNAAATGRTAIEVQYKPLPTSGTIALRAFYFLPTLPPNTEGRIMTMQQDVSPFQVVSLRLENGLLWLVSGLDSTSRHSSIAMPLNRWVCLELVVDIGPAGQIRAYLDNVELTELACTAKTQVNPSLAVAIFGSGVDNPPVPLPAYDLWLDEVAMDKARIGCDR